MDTYARKPQGRRQTAERAQFRRVAQTARLGTVTRAQLAHLAQALPCTGIVNATEAHLLQIIINTTTAKDFEAAGRPVVFKSNAQLAFEIGRTAGRVSRLLARLFDAGLVTMQDSGNYKRYPVRNAAGEITDACGIDLRVLVARYAELDELVRTARAERQAVNAAVRRYRGAVRTLTEILATASERPGFRHALALRCERVIAHVGIPSRAASGTLRRATALLEWLAERIFGLSPRAEIIEETGKMTCPHAENDMHKQNTNPNQPVSSNHERRPAHAGQLDLHTAGSASKRAFEESLWRGRDSVKPLKPEPAPKMHIDDIIRAVPAIATYGLQPPRSWGELARLVPLMCKFAGISEDARRRAEDEMGEAAAAAAVAVTFQKCEMQMVQSPGGYLRAMTERAARGQLHLTRSVHGLAALHRTARA